MEKLVSLCKRRGFIYPSSEIYGGIGSCWDYGPLGVELKMNIKNCWWKTMTRLRNDIEGLDASIIMHPQVWQSSGHLDGFSDEMVDCKSCKKRFREEETDGESCPECGGDLTVKKPFNLMFKTHVGAVENAANQIYLRPETAQGIYVNFLNVLSSSRKKIPFGIAQIGKAFRNEITPKNFIFRMREFEQMEMQYFINPSAGEKWFEFWRQERLKWYVEFGIDSKKLRFDELGEDDLPHYAANACDIQYKFPFGWEEVEGIHNRTDYDLRNHSKFSGKTLDYFDEVSNSRFVPHIIEVSAGVDRTLLAFLADAFEEEKERVVLRLSPKIAPIKAAVLPLVKRDGMPEIAMAIVKDLRGYLKVFYDDRGSIGRRYRRQDEAGTPFAVTVDSQTLKDNTVTIRRRDDMKQERVQIEELAAKLVPLCS